MPMYLTRFSYTPETWAMLIAQPGGPPQGRPGLHRIGRREAARLLVRLRRTRRLQPLGGPRQRLDGCRRAGDQRRRRSELVRDDRAADRRGDDLTRSAGRRASAIVAPRRVDRVAAEEDAGPPRAVGCRSTWTTSGRLAEPAGCLAADQRRCDRQVQLVDHPGGQGVAEQRRAALAQHVLVAERGQPVQRERQVDLVASQTSTATPWRPAPPAVRRWTPCRSPAPGGARAGGQPARGVQRGRLRDHGDRRVVAGRADRRQQPADGGVGQQICP